MAILSRNLAVRIAATTLMLLILATVVFAFPVVKFLYRERSLAESVRKYAETTGVYMTPDDEVRQYLVKLAQYHRMSLGEGDVEIDYNNTENSFGVPVRIGYTFNTELNFYGLKVLSLVAQRSFEVAKQQRQPQVK
jgi:hypothetical protein